MPIVSVILPTYNRLPQLQKVLTGLEAQTFPLHDFEVVVVSDGASDGTDEFLHSYSTPLHLRLYVQPNRGAAAARNLGIEKAQGDFVLFLDDDVVPAPDLMAEHLQTHQCHHGDVVVLGPMLTPQDVVLKPWVRWEQSMLYKQYADMDAGRWEPTARQFYTGNASLARHHLRAVGGFETTFRRAEDVELAYRLADYGLAFIFNPKAVGYHYAERSFASWRQTPYAYGRNDVIFARDRNQQWLLPTVMYEFQQRHPFVKALTQLCLSRQQLSALTVNGLKWVAELSNAAGIERLADRAYSGIFNLCYYQGIADELTGRQAFFQLANQVGMGGEAHPPFPTLSRIV
jgi:GT2 family glycosyltransferase